jgi:hypothetical protein
MKNTLAVFALFALTAAACDRTSTTVENPTSSIQNDGRGYSVVFFGPPEYDCDLDPHTPLSPEWNIVGTLSASQKACLDGIGPWKLRQKTASKEDLSGAAGKFAPSSITEGYNNTRLGIAAEETKKKDADK